MKTIYERIKASPILSILWTAAHSDKKLPRSTVRLFEITKALQCIGEAQDLKLNILSRFLLGLIKVYFLKYRIVYDDYHNVMSEKKVKARKKLFKALPLRPITVELGEKPTEVVETCIGMKGTETTIPHADEEIMEPSVTSNDNFEVGYDTIEDMRGSTTQSATATQIEIQSEKRKKSVLDSKIEYDQEFFDRKVRNLKEVLRREGLKKYGVSSILGIQPEIIQALMEKMHHVDEQSVEIARGQSTTDISYDMGYGDTYLHSKLSDSLDTIFGLHNLPDVFTFNVVVAGFSKRERANSFMALLTLISNGQVKSYQAEPYGPIECTIYVSLRRLQSPKFEAPMHKYQEYYEALSYEKRPTSMKQHVYTKGSTEYSTYKYVQKHTDFLLPQVLTDALGHKVTVGVVTELNSMWASLKKFTMWNYVNNTISEIEFTSPVTHFVVFKPKPNVFTCKITECALIVNRSQAIIYGLSSEAKEFISTGLVVSIPDRVISVSETQGSVFLGCANGNVYKVVYRSASIFSSQYMYLKDLDSSPFGFMFPAFFKLRRSSPVTKVVSGRYWMLALTENEVRIYSISHERVLKEGDIPVGVKYISAEIVEESETELFFYCVCRSGSRDFYIKDTLLFSRKAPFTDNDLNGVGVCTNANTMIVYKKAYSGNMVTVVHFNDDQTVNFSANKAAENFEILNVEGLREVFLDGSSIFCVTGQEVRAYSVMSTEEHLMHCRPEETYSFLKNYGERETLAFYYSIMSKNKDYTKLEHLYSKNEAARVPAFYSFVVRLIKVILKRKVDHDFFMESERITKRIGGVVSKLKIKDEFVIDLVETLNFLKIYYEYGLVVDETLSEILFESTSIKKTLLDKLINQFGGNMDTIVNLLLAKCPSFIPINEIYYQKGLECLEKGDLQASLGNFKNLSHDLDPIIEKFNALRFYVGSVVLLRKTERGLERRIGLLRESVQCWGSLSAALDDFSEDFSFCLFEALLANMQSSIYMCGTCECCGERSDSFTRRHFLSLSSPFLEAFLVEKSMLSFKKEEYSLLWKYYALNNLKDKAVESLLKIAENKPMKLDARLEYLNIAFSISPSKPMMLRLETAKLQRELLMKKYIPILDNLILSPNDLLNDYIIPNKCFGLGLRLVDLFEYCDPFVLKKLWSDALQQGHLKENLDFIKGQGIKKSGLNLEIIATILISKYDSRSPNLINFLVDCGFSKSEVLELFEKMIKDPRISHPMQKKKVLDILLQSNEGNTEYAKRVARYCQNSYGIK